MIQAKVLDLNRYWRTGGANWDFIQGYYDAVIFCANVGNKQDALLEEFGEEVTKRKIPYMTYSIPDHTELPSVAAEFYVSLPYVLDGIPIGDVEPMRKGGPLGTEYFYRKFFEHLDSFHTIEALYYSNYNNTNKLGNPQWIKQRRVWWAEYPYHWDGWRYIKYRDYSFLDDKPWWLPKWASRLGITPILHQFTDYGDGQKLGANEKTNDPFYKDGIKSVDLNVSLIDVLEFMQLWPDAEPGISDKEKLNKLWNAHPELH